MEWASCLKLAGDGELLAPAIALLGSYPKRAATAKAMNLFRFEIDCALCAVFPALVVQTPVTALDSRSKSKVPTGHFPPSLSQLIITELTPGGRESTKPPYSIARFIRLSTVSRHDKPKDVRNRCGRTHGWGFLGVP